MAVYTVHQPAQSTGNANRDAIKTVFISEGFSWPALWLTVCWPLFKGLWLVFLGLVAAIVAGEWAVRLIGLPVPGLASILIMYLFAFEANNLHRWTLTRRGWLTAGIVAGASLDDCERRFFDSQTDEQPAPAARPTPRPTGPVPPVGNTTVLGGFPIPDGPR